jgi:hypothetical protein
LPEILADQTEPVSGSVKLSLSNNFKYPAVFWYSNLHQIGVGTDAGNPIIWNAAAEANGTYLILAKIQQADGTYAEVRRTLTVADANLTMSAGVSGVTGNLTITVNPSSKYGVAKVEALFDGKPLGVLTEPNIKICIPIACVGFMYYFGFNVDAIAAGSGDHTLLLTMTDKAGNSKSITVPIPVSNPPVVKLSSPSTDNTFANGTLHVAGSYTTDKKGAVTVTASLGDYTFMQTGNQQFAQDLDLSGIKPGAYTLTVQAKDSTDSITTLSYTIIVTSTHAYQPLFTIGSNGQLLAAEGNKMLYSSNDGKEIRVRDTATGQEKTLSNTGNLSDWQISNGYVYATGQITEADCATQCIYQWSSSGSMRNLSNANSYPIGTYSHHPVAHGNYVMWNNYGATSGTTASYTLYDANSQTYTQIASPADASGSGYITEYDFSIQNGIISVFYAASTGGSGSDANDIFRWRSDTQTSIRLTTNNIAKRDIRTDGVQVAWIQSLPSNTWPLFSTVESLLVQPVAGGETTVLSSDLRNYAFAGNGVLSWLEAATPSALLKVKTPTGISTLSSNNPTLHGAGSGYVIFSKGYDTYSWNSATGKSTLLFDTMPNQVLVSGNMAYFAIGNSKTVYKVVLN